MVVLFYFPAHQLQTVNTMVESSVADPDPPDPHVFGTPESGSRSISRGMDPDPDSDSAPDPSIIMQN